MTQAHAPDSREARRTVPGDYRLTCVSARFVSQFHQYSEHGAGAAGYPAHAVRRFGRRSGVRLRGRRAPVRHRQVAIQYVLTRLASRLPPRTRDTVRDNPRRRERMAEQQGQTVAIVDASNVAHSTEGETARLENITLVCERLREDGFSPVVVADAALRHQIDQQREYEELVENGTIRQAPAGTDADFFILSFARELDAAVVSNDRYRDRLEAFPDARDRVIRYMIVNGEVVFEKRTKRR